MTVTVKLDAMLEEQLRQRAAASGATTSDVIRQALLAYLNAPVSVAAPSAHALGAGLFGRHRGAPDLAERRKALLADAWADKHRERG
jgi:predicted transcriptional regulator